MRVIKTTRLAPAVGVILGVVAGLAGCATASEEPINPRQLAQSAKPDTHLGWKPAPANELSYSLATSSGIASMEMRALPLDLQALTIELPGMRSVEGIHWQPSEGHQRLLFDSGEGADGMVVKRRKRGYLLQVSGAALDSMRGGGLLTVIDYYRR